MSDRAQLHQVMPPAILAGAPRSAAVRSVIIAVTAFLTVVDLFATQAILPSLARAYGVGAGTIGTAVNACTLGMAIGGLAVALLGSRINRRHGILASLTLLAIPTGLLAIAPDLTSFTLLRIVQGVLMSTAFALTLSHLSDQCSAADTAGAFAAYITGNVASNLFGRMMSAGFTDHLGLAGNFGLFAALNLAGAVFVYFTLGAASPAAPPGAAVESPMQALRIHLRNGAMRATFGIGFLILFAFIGTFSYVNFVLVAAPIGLSRMQVGFVYLVFLPSILTTPLAGRAVARYGSRTVILGALALAGAGLPLLLVPQLAAVMAGLCLVGIGCFFAQAAATGHVGRAATADRGTASGIYLASYFCGGIVGSIVLGRLFDHFGWAACVAGIAMALTTAALLASRLRMPPSVAVPRST